MKKLIGTTLLSLVMSTAVLAEGVVYHIFADGLACQHCALSIDEKLRETDGVERVDILPGDRNQRAEYRRHGVVHITRHFLDQTEFCDQGRRADTDC